MTFFYHPALPPTQPPKSEKSNIYINHMSTTLFIAIKFMFSIHQPRPMDEDPAHKSLHYIIAHYHNIVRKEINILIFSIHVVLKY